MFDMANLDKEVAVTSIGEMSDISAGVRCVVQGEYNKAGDEVWFSV